jgi:hypothetical protein
VLFEKLYLYQLRWNGDTKTAVELDKMQNYIWSSSTLYSKDIREKRANWFHTFLDTKPEVNPKELLDFHRYTEGNNSEHGLVINRNDLMKTLSITQTVIEKNKVTIVHHDLIKQNQFSNSFITI